MTVHTIGLEQQKRAIGPYYFSPEWIALRTLVVQMNQSICAYCGCQGYQADHVIPRSKGGVDAVSNLVCACARCNQLLGGQVFDSFEEKAAWLKAKLIQIAGHRKRQEAARTRPCAYKRISKIRGCPNLAKPGSTYCDEHHEIIVTKNAANKPKQKRKQRK